MEYKKEEGDGEDTEEDNEDEEVEKKETKEKKEETEVIVEKKLKKRNLNVPLSEIKKEYFGVK